MGGGAVRGNNYLVDGFPVTDLQNRASTNPSIEAVQDMKVQIHTYDAEMGRTGGGVMNMSAKSGANDFHGSAYYLGRPTSLVDQLLIPKLQGQPNKPEEWKDGGWGGGGPIVKNHTFFWFAGEKYVDNQPQQSQFLVPTAAELTGNFQGVTRNGVQQTIKDPLTGQPFPNNIIPASRLNPIGVKLASYLPPADTQVDNGAANFSMTDLLPNKALQLTTKVDHHFNDRVAVSGFYLRQVTHEASTNYNPVNDFVGSSYQLDRVINTFVANNTYVLNDSTVLTLRGGYNHFDDNYNLNDRNGNPLNFDVTSLGWPTSLTSQMSDTHRFPTMSITGYKGSGWTNKLTVNYGLRLERETGLQERDNQITVNFDQTAVNPLNSMVSFVDPITKQPRQLLGGLIFAGQNGAPTVQGNQPAIKPAPRAGAVYSFNDKTVLRGGWGLYFSPWNYPAAGTTGWGQLGYSSQTNVPQPTTIPTVSMSNPFPTGLIQPTGNSLGLLTGAGGDVYFIDPNKGAPRVQQYSVDLQRELPGGVSVGIGYSGLTGSNMSWGGSSNALININQIDPKYQSLLTTTSTLVSNPFFGVAAAGTLSTRQTIEIGQLIRPFPEFGNVYMQQSTGAHSQYHAAIVQVRKRTTGVWGGTFSYTYSRLNDNQFGESNYYSSNPGVQNYYAVIPGSPYYNPDAEYGRSLLDSPHKLVIAPILNLPFGKGQRFMSESALGDALLGGWTVTTVITLQSGFPIGVTQNLTSTAFLYGSQTNQRPNLVPGQDFLVPGDITDRIDANVNDNLFYNKAAFANAPANQFGSAPRMLPGVLSPWRNNVDLGVSKQIRTGGGTSASVRIEVLNMFNIVQWAAPASSSFGNSSFGQINNQANNMRMVQFTVRFQF